VEGVYSRCMGWVHAPPLPWLPPKLLLKLEHFSISLEVLVFFCEIFLYLKLKWSSLGSPLGISFCENLTTIKIKQKWQ
jgi:hypothetical protein